MTPPSLERMESHRTPPSKGAIRGSPLKPLVTAQRATRIIGAEALLRWFNDDLGGLVARPSSSPARRNRPHCCRSAMGHPHRLRRKRPLAPPPAKTCSSRSICRPCSFPTKSSSQQDFRILETLHFRRNSLKSN